MRAYVFDIDGTLSDLTHRLHYISGDHKDWDGFFNSVGGDAVHEHIADLARHLITVMPIIIMSGRSEQCRRATEQWLDKHNIPYNGLYMRKEGDHRPDFQVKRELLLALRSDEWEPIMAFDDRDQVVEMWRTEGIPCAQVAAGNF